MFVSSASIVSIMLIVMCCINSKASSQLILVERIVQRQEEEKRILQNRTAYLSKDILSIRRDIERLKMVCTLSFILLYNALATISIHMTCFLIVGYWYDQVHVSLDTHFGFQAR